MDLFTGGKMNSELKPTTGGFMALG